MADSLAKRMVALLEDALTKNIGVTTINNGGEQISFANRDQMVSEYIRWKKIVAIESGRRPLFRGIDIGSAW